MIVADTGAILALIDKSDRHHQTLLALFEDRPSDWILPWAILAEVDYLVGAHVGAKAHEAWLDDLASGAFQVEWGLEADLTRAARKCIDPDRLVTVIVGDRGTVGAALDRLALGEAAELTGA